LWVTPIVWRWSWTRGRRAAVWAEPRLARGIDLTGKPFEGSLARYRSIVGYFAMWTGLLAVSVWGFLLLFRGPTKTPEPPGAPVTLISDAKP